MSATEVRQQEISSLYAAISDPEVRIALQAFVTQQAREFGRLCVGEIKKSQPDTLKAAQHAGRMDAYETLLPELEFFIKNRLAE